MPRNQGEKKSSLLDYETMKASAVVNRDYLNEVKGKIAALKDVDFERLVAMSGVFDLNHFLAAVKVLVYIAWTKI